MMGISKETAMDIALAYREIEAAEQLLKEVEDERTRYGKSPDIRDAFGRPVTGLQLGVPSGNNSQRLFNVPWNLCRPIIEAHIASKRALISALNEKALIELGAAQ
jgi:hypothetical protein